ncbi:MAG: HD-GYP domain-containing protein [Anaeroplasma sp.]
MENINNEYSEANSNKFSIKCIVVTTLILYVTWILNLLDIFIIDSSIYLVAVIGGTLICAFTFILSLILDLNKGYVKYIFLFLATVLYAFVTSCLTYHTTIALIFPIIYSAQYRSKKAVWYTYALTAVSILFYVVFGYKYGLCDANMVFYTCTTTKAFISNFSQNSLIYEPNWFNNILFFAVPKILVVLGAVPMVFHLNSVIDNRTNELIETQKKNLDLSKEIVSNQQKVIVSLASIIESRDQITGNHIKNTAKYVEFLINKMCDAHTYENELTNEYGLLVIEAAPLHDIGKIHIPDSILCKNGKLTDEEYTEMKKHPKYGYEILSNFGDKVTNNDYLKMAKDVCLYHHERYDGKGYPNGLKGNEIPLCARIMAVADVLDALLSKRQYKDAYNFEKTYSILQEESGKQFDPIVLSVLLNNWEELKNNIYTNE